MSIPTSEYTSSPIKYSQAPAYVTASMPFFMYATTLDTTCPLI